MAPLGQVGDFGYSDRELGQDRIEVTYTGAAIRVSSTQGRNDSRVAADRDKVHDLALWRAAQIADKRGMAAMKIENEERDTEVQVTHQNIYPPYPYWGRPYYWRHPYYWHRPSWFYEDDYYYQPVRRAYAQTTTTLTVQLLKEHDPNDDAQLAVKETLTRLQAARAGAVY